jgi:hypothetical protein
MKIHFYALILYLFISLIMALTNNKIRLIAILFFGMGLTGLQAQNKLYVKEKTGTQLSFAFKSIRKIIFTTDNMMVDLTDGNSGTCALDDIRYLNFIDLTTDVSQINSKENRYITLYPNPVDEELTVVFQSSFQGILQIDLINMQGKITYRKTVDKSENKKKLNINILDIPKGLYVCRLFNGQTIETSKFIKN